MVGITLSVRTGKQELFVPERSAEEAIERLEKHALRYPETREEILSALNSYAYKFRGTAGGKAARMSIKRIAAVAMLEVLSGKEEG